MNNVLIRKDGHQSIAFPEGMGEGIDPSKVDRIVDQHVLLREDGFLTAQVTSGSVIEGRKQAIEIGLSPDDFSEKELAMGGLSSHFEKFRVSGNRRGLFVISSLSTFIELVGKGEAGTERGRQGEEVREEAVAAIHNPNILYVANFRDEASGKEMRALEKFLEEQDKGLATVDEENDEHAANIAIAADAEILMLLTAAVEGFMYKGKKLDVINVEDIDKYLEYILQNPYPSTNGKKGKGGMKTKLLAAKKAAQSGTRVVIASSFQDSRRILEDNAGTWVVQ